jgi:predicted SnoaL-like aldol condensation-catalyzing enzyme
MSIEANKTIARRFVEEMMNGQHVERIEEFVAPDALHHERGGSWSYRQALHNVFDDPRHGWQFVVDDAIAEGDKVVVRCTASYMTWEDKNALGIPYKPGTRAYVWHAHIFRVEDGLIAEHWPVREIWDAVRQFNAPTLVRTLVDHVPA